LYTSKGGKGTVSGTQPAENEDTIGERHNKTRNRSKDEKKPEKKRIRRRRDRTRRDRNKDAIRREVEWEKLRESGTKRGKRRTGIYSFGLRVECG
jgi:hypothetical protein